MSEMMALPHSVQAEEALLGSALIDSGVARQWGDVIKSATGDGESYQPGDFHIVKNGWLWGAVCGLVRAGHEPDAVSIGRVLGESRFEECGGVAWLAQLMTTVPSALNATTYARIVLDMSARRRLLRSASQIAKMAFDTALSLDEVVGKATGLVSAAMPGTLRGEPRTAKAVLDDVLARIERIMAGEESAGGLPTGLMDLDKVTWGMFPGDLIYVAARPRIGKSALLGTIADNVARRLRRRVLVFSLEMPAETWLGRTLAGASDVDFERVRLGTLTDADLQRVTLGAGAIGDAALWIDDTSGQTDGDLRSKARRLHDEVGLDLVVVDYVQLVRASIRQASRYLEVGFVSGQLKDMARELRLPVAAACMVGRAVESSADKMPGLADLRESGSLEADADQVWFINRPEVYDPSEKPGIAEIKVDKNRNGPTGLCDLQFDRVRQRYQNLARKALSV